MILALAAAASIAAGTCASHARPERGGRFAKPATKGVELYSWRAGDASPRFSLHWGTNRAKSEAEIKAAECTLGSVEALEALGVRMEISPPAVPERRQPVSSQDQPAPGRVAYASPRTG